MRILLDESIPEKLGFTLGRQVAQYLDALQGPSFTRLDAET